MRFHTQTAGVSLTAQQPLNNIVRTAIEALAGVLGGTQSLHTNSYDEALALPTEQAVRVALRTQQIIAHETGVTNTIDPLGGAYFVEALTDELEARRTTTSPRSTSSADGGGGQAGFCSARSATPLRAPTGDRPRRRIVVGVDGYPSATSGRWSSCTSTRPRAKQVGRVQRRARRREGAAVERELTALRRAAAARTSTSCRTC